MKYVENFSNEMKSTELLGNIAKNPLPGKGMDLGEMRKRIRLVDVIEGKNNPDGYFAFEDADWDYLVDLAKQTQFNFFHRDILTIMECVEKATSTLPSEEAKT